MKHLLSSFLCFCFAFLCYLSGVSQTTNATPVENIGVLKEKLDGSYYQTKSDGNVYFAFEEDYNASGLTTYKVYDAARNDVTPALQGPLTDTGHNTGLNVYGFFLGGNGAFQFNKYYYLEVSDAKGKVWKMRFLFKGNENTVPDGQ